MKRFCAGLLAFCLLITCGCTAISQKPAMYVVDGAYNLTPQEFIDRVNQHVKAQNDSEYKTIPAFEKSGEEIEITRGLHLEIETNEAGQIFKIQFSWIGQYSDAVKNAGLLMGTTIGLLTNEKDGDAVIEELNMMDPEKSGYDSYSGCNGSRFWYSSVERAKYNFLTIQPDISESQEVSDAIHSDPVESSSLDISNGPAFDFTWTDFIEPLRKAFNALPDEFDVPNAFENEPSKTESFGCAVYTYEVDTCTEVVIYAHPETDNILRFIIRSNSNKMTEENATTFETYAAFFTVLFATDDELDEMNEKLAIADTPYTQDTVNLFNGRNAKFSYTITDGLLSIRISPAD